MPARYHPDEESKAPSELARKSQAVKEVSLETFMKHACAVLESNGHPILSPNGYRAWDHALYELKGSAPVGTEIPDSVRILKWREDHNEVIQSAFDMLIARWTIFTPNPRSIEYKFSIDWPEKGRSALKDAMEELGQMPEPYQKAVEALAEKLACRVNSVKPLGIFSMFAEVELTPVPLRKISQDTSTPQSVNQPS